MKTSRYFLLALIIAAFQALPAATIAVTPSAQSVTLGDQAAVSLDISGLGAGVAPSVGVFDLDLSFNASVLALNSVVFGDPVLGDQLDLFSLGSIATTTPGVGAVNIFELSLDLPTDLDTLQAGAFTLVTVTFDTLALGSSALNLTVHALGDSLGLELPATVSNGSVDVEEAPVQVPEPPEWLTYGLLLASVAVSGVCLTAKSALSGE